ncbi:MAG: hypothetical protein K0R50_1456 [Eubacterium sp.]|jgi:hypothetical protein|nr:hypothetical protein [Eubacterium sp.]
MSDSAGNCPTPDMILKYFYMELDEEETNIIETHFAICSRCHSEYDYYGAFIEQITPSAKVQKELWLNSNSDTFSVAAAASYGTAGTSELISNDGKYHLKKIAYMDDSCTSLLVVKLIYPGISGRISVYMLEDYTSIFIGSELTDEDNKVCFEVSSDIKLTNLLVTFILSEIE